MPALPLYDFSGGIDRRADRTLTSPKALWVARNVYVDNSGRLRRRPPMALGVEASLCAGLVYFNGAVRTFSVKGTAYSSPYPVIELDSSGGGGAGSTTIINVHFAGVFGQYVYVVVSYDDLTTRHHYVDGSADTRITDANCPQSRNVTIVNNRVWATTTVGTVRYCAAGSPRDWTTTNNAGFLPVSNNMAGVGNPTALGQYQTDLVVFFENAAQVWNPDTNPTNMAIRQRIYDLGTTVQAGVVPFSNDLGFISQGGIRSLTISSQTTNREDNDIGSAIDEAPLGVVEYSKGGSPGVTQTLVYPRYGTTIVAGAGSPFARYFSRLGQVWFVFPNVRPAEAVDATPPSAARTQNTSVVAVLTFSKIGRTAAWSYYHFPFALEDLVWDAAQSKVVGWALVPRGVTFRRTQVSTDELLIAGTALGDNAGVTPIDWQAEGPFVDMKLPGILKSVFGADVLANPGCDLSFRYDPNNPSAETSAQPIVGPDTRPNGLVPVEVTSVSIAPVLRGAQLAADVTISGLQLYYDALGPL